MTTQTTENPFRILVVDDEPDVPQMFKMRLRRQIRDNTYAFEFAKNGVEALEILGEADTPKVDMVISDINMPNMNGMTLLERIGQESPDLKSIIVSAFGDIKNIRAAMNRGAFDFVTKPIDFEDLVTTIEKTKASVLQWKDVTATRQKLTSLQNEIEVASNMQNLILPTEFPDKENFNVFGKMKPAMNVSGDFYDIFELNSKQIGLIVADVSGKGIPAAMFMMVSRTLMKSAAMTGASPSKALRMVNALLHEDNRSMMFVTVIYAIYDPETGNITYANGGHCNPVVIHTDGECSELPPTGGTVLGLLPELEYQQKSTMIMPGETLLLYSDGVTEARNSKSEELGIQGLKQIFREQPPGERRSSRQPHHRGRGDLRRRHAAGRRHNLLGPAPQSRMMQPATATLRLGPGRYLQPLKSIQEAVEDIADRDNWSLMLAFKVNMVLEELTTNVLKYGSEAGQEPPRMTVWINSQATDVTVQFSDTGAPFNPLEKPPPLPDFSQESEEIHIGGVGLHLVRNTMDTMFYRREHGRNTLTMTIRK